MAEKTGATLHVPLDLDITLNTTGARLVIPDDLQAWAEKLKAETTDTEKVHLSISNLTDCPGTFELLLQGYPLNVTMDDLDNGKMFGLEVNRDFLTALHDAIGFLLAEERREDPEGTLGKADSET